MAVQQTPEMAAPQQSELPTPQQNIPSQPQMPDVQNMGAAPQMDPAMQPQAQQSAPADRSQHYQAEQPPAQPSYDPQTAPQQPAPERAQSSFIEQAWAMAAQGQTRGEPGPTWTPEQESVAAGDNSRVGGEPAEPSKRLFASGGDRPKILFVATTLVLFGTSALLLYGMSKNKTGDVTPVNAIERDAKQLDRPPLASRETPSVSPQDGNLPVAGSGTGPATTQGLGRRSDLTGESSGGKLEDRIIGQGPSQNKDLGNMADELGRQKAARIAANGSVYRGTDGDVGVTGALPDKSDATANGYVQRQNSRVGNQSGGLPATIGTVALRNRALNGMPEAQFEVAELFARGTGGKTDPEAAIAWYRKAAKRGYAPAYHRLALAYERGKGVPKNMRTAVDLYLVGARKGNVKAMHNLGVIYTAGGLGRIDYKSAIKWYRKAAERGITDSQFNRAIMYQSGLGVPVNQAEAYKWYWLAGKGGDKEAQRLAQQLRKQLSVRQLGEADGEVVTWRPTRVDPAANYLGGRT
jgi:TPR repeat protein